jgi:ABC-type transport system involved in cytochrome bd biosynthesis fused ATPase/permease subunit
MSDNIVLLDRGIVVANGKYQTLIETNHYFQNLMKMSEGDTPTNALVE